MLKGKHAFGPRGFGPWLFNVTEVDPNNPGNARPLQDFSKKELDQWCTKHKVLYDLPINKETESLPNIIDAVLLHYKETGVLKGILLPFIQEESDLQQPHEIMYPLNQINLNYGPDGKGGQSNPKPRHILE